ncbi:MAG: hypothetical protein H7222_10485 [Methylotenera sp.]|nr:hypothetical protein [Oligoflexia bacterium]
MKNQWQAWIHVKWKAGAPSTAWESWKTSSAIRGVWSTTGQWDCSIWLDVKTPDELEDFVWKQIRGNQWVEQTETTWAKQWFEAGSSSQHKSA